MNTIIYKSGRKLDKLLKENLNETYKIDKLISSTDKTRVFHAISLQDNKNYIIKIFDKECFSFEYYDKLSKIASPFFCTPISKTETSNNVILIYNEYKTLSALINENLLTEKMYLSYLCNIASAVADLHSNHLSHCDISIPNILINKDNDFALLTDFPLNNKSLPHNNNFKTDIHMLSLLIELSINIKLSKKIKDIIKLKEFLYKQVENASNELLPVHIFKNYLYKKTAPSEGLNQKNYDTVSSDGLADSSTLGSLDALNRKTNNKLDFKYPLTWCLIALLSIFMLIYVADIGAIFHHGIYHNKNNNSNKLSVTSTDTSRKTPVPSALKDNKALNQIDLSSSKLNNLKSAKDSFLKTNNPTVIYLHDNNLTTLSDIPLDATNCNKIEEIYLSNNKLSDINYLKNLKNLKTLVLSDNPVSDISCLKNLLNLTFIDLSDTKVSDISYLNDNTFITFINLHGCDISDSSLKTFKKNHPKCQIII